MTETLLLLLNATIWMAPHATKAEGRILGCIFLVVVACKGLGWL